MNEKVTVTVIDNQKPQATGMRGGYDGASNISRELAMFNPPLRSADGDILPQKNTLDARGRNLINNNGYATGAVATHKDSVVGSLFMLKARPNWKVLKLDETWCQEFQEEAEALFSVYAEGDERLVDASGHNTLTELTRLVVGCGVFAGEAVGAFEWVKDRTRAYNTAVQLIDTDRLSNPNGTQDTTYLRGGVEMNSYGAAVKYWFRESHPTDSFSQEQWKWRSVAAKLPWGRPQVIHIYERMRPDQTRGVAEMVSVLKNMRMTNRFNDLVLQNVVLNASYAATIESELPRDAAMESIGAVGTGSDAMSWANQYLEAVTEFTGGGKNMHIDGVKIPYLYPGSKLQLRPVGNPGGIGDRFEDSLLRHIAAGLGLSYEQFTRDYSKVNYSSARASMTETGRYMASKKRMYADRFASSVYANWLEEAINRGDITTIPKSAPSFYDRLMRAAYTRCAWIGASRGQINELDESQAAVLRMNNNMSTLERECANLGTDWREVMQQRKKEQDYAKELGIELMSTDATKPGANQALNTMRKPKKKGNDNADAADSSNSASED